MARNLETPAPRAATRPTRAIVDLDALAANLRVVRERAACQVYGVVKADAYGHGLLPVARRLEQEGVDGLCVALVEEGLSLRDAGVAVPILVLNAAYGDDHGRVIEAGLTPVVYSLEHIQAFQRSAGSGPVSVHLKVDTGMARLGVRFEELEALLSQVRRQPGFEISGLMTHLSSADTDPEATREQLERFERSIERVREGGYDPRMLHVANSAGTLAFPEGHYGMVRVGLALYGVSPLRREARWLRPVMRWETEIVSVRRLPRGAPIGYDRTFHTQRDSVIATVPLGYGDGFLVAASNRAHMLVGGRRCPVVGRVSMDLTTLDVTDLADVAVGDPVVILGSQGSARQSATELAEACRTIPYEVLTSVSPRVPRLYVP